jgi:hypothetical protein
MESCLPPKTMHTVAHTDNPVGEKHMHSSVARMSEQAGGTNNGKQERAWQCHSSVTA